MKDFFNNSLTKIQEVADKSVGALSDQWSLVVKLINDLPVFISLEHSNAAIDYDEKHYFVVPYKLSEVGIALHSVRSLPNGVPEINDLPKRRVFHFPNKHAEFLVRELLLEQSRESVLANSAGKKHSLEELANDIDKLDKKLTYGMLLVGGAAAIVNPVLGAGIAAKALLPGAAGLLNKYGLQPLGKKLSKSQLAREIKQAEQKVLSEFKHASTLQVLNPILQELELAINTDEATHDPLLDFDMSQLGIAELDGIHWRELTEKAVYQVYKECLSDRSQHKKACLGPEDLRWFSSLLIRQIERKQQ